MRQTFLLTTLLLVAGLLLAACGGDDNDDSAGETPTPTATVDAPAEPDDDAQTPDVDDPEGEEAEEAGHFVGPDRLTLVAESGEQQGDVGPHFWVDEQTGLGLEATGPLYPRQEEPLVVSAGEELSIEGSEDRLPEEITVEIFEAIDPNEDGMVEIGAAEPLSAEEIDAGDATWTADLEPGDHYVVLQTIWDTPEGWDRDSAVEYRFWIRVD